jgi:WhiB family transcriptional regulator, redox-sensing transcriptional regulator
MPGDERLHDPTPELEALMDPNTDNANSIPDDGLATWMAAGLCRDIAPEVFFPSTGSGVVAAQKVCRRCPVAEQCLDYALAHRIEFGVWGGVSERGRRRLLSARRHASLADTVSDNDDSGSRTLVG